MKYNVEITELGEMAPDLFETDMMIIFNNNAPSELAEISVLHTITELASPVEVGDKVTIGSMEYTVCAVGGEANHTLKTLGHCTLYFADVTEAELPGQVCLKGNPFPAVNVGDKITIE